MRFVVGLERAWDAARLRRGDERPPSDFRIEAYLGHAGPDHVVVRGRVLDDPPPTEAVEGEGVRAAVLRTLSGFVTDELPGVPLRVRVGDASVTTTTDQEGYFLTRLPASGLSSPWTEGTVELDGEYRGVTEPHTTPVRVRVAGRLPVSASSPTSTTPCWRPGCSGRGRCCATRSPARR